MRKVSLTTTVPLFAAICATALASDGGSSSHEAYLTRSAPGVVIKPLLTVGDAAGTKPDGSPYRLVGIPDGLGAFDNGDGTFTLLVSHELFATQGTVRAHGARGAFISKWTVRKEGFVVERGEDLIRQVALWNPATGAHDAPARGALLSRLCSADLPPAEALYNPTTGRGFSGRLFMNGEELGANGRAFAHGLDGTSYQLPHLGRYAFENLLVNPATGDRTVVAGTDDNGQGQVYVYAGEKQAGEGLSPVERAGLTNGLLFGVKVDGLPAEPAAGVPTGTPFSVHGFGDVSRTSGGALESLSDGALVTRWNKPEDGHWDPSQPNHFYFVTTATFDGPSRLYRLEFIDAARPELGGVVAMLLDGSEGHKQLDNMTITRRGRVILTEDTGNLAHRSKLWAYDVATDVLQEIAAHSERRFAPGGPDFLTQDEEASGVIDASEILGEGWLLTTVQAHFANPDPELATGGQLLAIHVPPGRPLR